ncbi:MAG: hypothetical protein M3464_19115 [Chloroflexota bacterium]|nr:hypothetical protein [Chloroflexota bacterium]
MEDTAGTGTGFALLAGAVLVVAILVGWVVFVARQQRWSIGHQALVGGLGAVVFVIVIGYLSSTFLWLQLASEASNLSPTPILEWIGTPDPT